MITPIFLILITLLFLIMWGWIIMIFIDNYKIKMKIEALIEHPLTLEQKEIVDNLQLDLDTNAYRAKNVKIVVLVFGFLYSVAAVAIVWLNAKYSFFTYDGLVTNLKLTMLIIVLFFTPGYIGLEVISNTEGASGNISSRLKFSEELKAGEEVEI